MRRKAAQRIRKDGLWPQSPIRSKRRTTPRWSPLHGGRKSDCVKGSVASSLFEMTLRVAILGWALAACSAKIPHPPQAAQPTSALVEVDYPPPPARVEFVPERPRSEAVWLNGEWTWTGRRWSWKPGGWVVVPPGAAYAHMIVVRRNDGRLFSAPGTWRDAEGNEVQAPEFIRASPSKSSAVVDPEGDPVPTGTDLARGDAGADAPGRGQQRESKEEEEKS